MISTKHFVCLIITLIGCAVWARVANAQEFFYPVGVPDQSPTKVLPNANDYRVTGDFRDQFGHTGVDLANNFAGGEVRAITDGDVILALPSSESAGFGNVVLIQHTLSGGVFYSLYAHLQDGAIGIGHVTAGERIGNVGTTGASTGPHLHFAIKRSSILGCGYINSKCRSEAQSGFSNYENPLRFIADRRAASPSSLGKLNDTGIISAQCYQAGSDVLVDCGSAGAIALTNAQDGMVGRDTNPATNSNTDGKLGFSFSAVPGGCVQDNVTGLMWEVKTNDGGLRDWTKTYTNYSATYDPNFQYGTATDASGFVTAVNATNLCGYSDWRLPTANELQSIVDYGVAYPGPAIDTSWFPNTQGSSFWWTSSPYVGTSYYAWSVYFDYGGVGNDFRDNGFPVRLVRAGQPASPRYTVSSDGQEVTDNQTNLIWRRCAEGMNWDGATCAGVASAFTHEEALQLAATQAVSTGVAWRLPNIKELSSITDRNLTYPAIDTVAFPSTPANWFWSSSPSVGYSYFAWYVGFDVGGVYGSYRVNGSSHVRLVRAGQ